MSLSLRPLTIAQANMLIETLHRHHKPVVGHRFSLGAYEKDILVGAAVVGRPVARGLSPYEIAEVTRLVTDGSKNTCSFLYSACARVCREMGFKKIQTYILETERGTSLLAAGWTKGHTTSGGSWSHGQRLGKRREDQPTCPKVCWYKELNG